MKTSRNHGQLNFEKLEYRRVLAGNVQAFINDSILLVVGDESDNQIEISQDNAGQFVINGLNTTVNGSDQPTVISGIPRHVTISMGSGADDVTVNNVGVSSNFSFYGGFGNDRLETNGLQARHFHAEGSPGNDVFILNASIRKSTYLFLGAGNDIVSSDNLNIGRNLKIFGQGGNDTVATGNVHVGRKMELHMSDGNDQVLLSGNTSVGMYARIALGAGNDFAGVMPTRNGGSANINGFLNVNAQEGNNNLAFDSQVRVNGTLRAEPGPGNNALRLGGADAGRIRSTGFGVLSEANLNNLIDQVFVTLENAGIGVPDVTIPLQASTSNQELVVQENADADSIDVGFTLESSEQITGAVITIGNFVEGQEELQFTSTLGITGNFDATTGVLTLTGNTSAATYQTAIQNVLYRNSSDTPLTDSRQFEIVITDNDETVTVTRQFRVASVNDLPGVTPTNANQTIGTGDLPTVVDGGLVVSDLDSTTLVSAEVSFESGFVAGEDVLKIDESAGITASFDGNTGIMTLNGTANLTDWQTVLRSLTYDNQTANPTFGTRTIQISVNDGTDSNTTVFQINLQAPAQPNNFDVSSSAVSGTVVGTIETTATFQTPMVYQFADSNVAADVLLNADDHLSGSLTAPVLLIEYLDYQCPACAAAHPNVNQMLTEFDGELLVVRRHLPLEAFHANAREAALFAEAAARQGMFEAMSDQLFENQATWAGLADPTSVFEGFANAIGLDMTQLQTDLADVALNDRVTRDLNEAVGLGFTSTPTFLLQNTQLAVNPGNIDAFRTLLTDAANNVDQAFTVNRRTGEIVVLDSSLLSTSNSPVTLSILVKDANGTEETISVTINVN